MSRTARFFLATQLLVSPMASATVALAGEYDGYADHDGDDDQHRGEDQMLRQQQKEWNRDQLDAVGDRSERAQEREERLEEKQERRQEEDENGGAGVRQFFKGDDQ